MSSIRLGIIANTGKPAAVDIIPSFLSWLRSRGISFVLSTDLRSIMDVSDCKTYPPDEIAGDVDFVLSFGGDGTFLQTAHLVAPHQVPIIGVNLGVFGYLAEVGIEQLQKRIDDLLNGNYIIQERVMLKAYPGEDTEKQLLFGLNDIVIENGEFPKTIQLVTYVDGGYLNTFNADGLIVSTPTGSTGYSLSVGGPIIEPEVDAMIISPVNPHMLANRPLVVGGKRTIEITTHSKAGKFQVVADGQHILKLETGIKMTIMRAPYKTQLLLFDDHDFYALLRNKLQWKHQFDVRVDPDRIGKNDEPV